MSKGRLFVTWRLHLKMMKKRFYAALVTGDFFEDTDHSLCLERREIAW